jgi:hypothetical protein
MDNLVLKYENGKSYSFSKKPSINFSPMDVGLKVPNDGYKYVRILHDYETQGYPRQQDWGIKYAIPAIMNSVRRVAPDLSYISEVYRGRAYDYVTLTKEWQFFLLELWRWSVGNSLIYGEHIGTYKNASNPEVTFDKYTSGSLLEYYTNMIQDARSHTDSESPEVGFCDFVTERNMGKKPYSWLTKTTTGNLLRVKRDMGAFWEVYALDLAKAPPKVSEIEKSFHLLHWATEQGMTKYANGTYSVSAYPQAEYAMKMNGSNLKLGTPIPNTSVGGYYLIEKKHTILLTPGQSWSPYNPNK